MTRNLPEHLKPVSPSPIHAAKISGLQYTTDKISGITRRGTGKHIQFYDPKGRRIRNPIELRRIKSLAVPPAWTNVWISPFSDSHLQATGRDARGRKQYRYHPRWREARDQTKYDRLIPFGRVLPKLRTRVAKDLGLPGLPRDKVMATIVKLLETTFIRIGNDEYARENQSFGLTTMRNKHVKIRGSKIRFRFRGKSGIVRDMDLSDRKLAQIVRRCQDLPGQELFQYLDEAGAPCAVNSSDVNDYLREVTGIDLTAKDFRTWAGTILAARALGELKSFGSKAEAKRNLVTAIESVAKRLGNTRAVCHKCYIHPAILSSYLDGTLVQSLSQPIRPQRAGSFSALIPEEAAVMAILAQTSKTGSNKKAA
jgi:DNA topoisomerase-1